jgi:molecular chaperone GrpE
VSSSEEKRPTEKSEPIRPPSDLAPQAAQNAQNGPGSDSHEEPSEAKESEPEIKLLKKELEEVLKKNNDLTNRMKYLQADIVNLQRQSDKMLVDVRNQARFGLILELISIKEDLERAMNAEVYASNLDSLIEGLKLLQTRIESTLKSEDVSAIRVNLGSKLDPRLHEAVSSKSIPDKEDGAILSVISPGYVVAGKVLKPALVEVARMRRLSKEDLNSRDESEKDAASSAASPTN